VTSLRRCAIAAAALLACAVPLGVAQAQDGSIGSQTGKDTIAVATTEVDGARAFDFEWSLQRQRGGIVDQRNIANAAARCTDCRATAIAFQVVLVTGSPSQLTPLNQAVAINDQCTRCVVYAGARQFVRVVAEGTQITRDGLYTLVDVRRDLAALEGQDLDPAALTAVVEAQEARVLQVLTEELVTSRGKHSSPRDRDDNQADDS
jgi:putative peptide zinc metalloprotease protein